MRDCVKDCGDNILSYKEVKGIYTWSEQDSCWHGKLTNMGHLYTFEGDFFTDLKQAFADTVVEYLEGTSNEII